METIKFSYQKTKELYEAAKEKGLELPNPITIEDYSMCERELRITLTGVIYADEHYSAREYEHHVPYLTLDNLLPWIAQNHRLQWKHLLFRGLWPMAEGSTRQPDDWLNDVIYAIKQL